MEDLIESCAVDENLTLRYITPAMMTTWELAHPGVRENESIKYQYDASTQRLIVQCAVSPVHDSAQIFFQNCVFDSVQPRLGRAKFNRIVQVSTGSCECHPLSIDNCAIADGWPAYGGFTGDWNTESVKQPDAYVHVKGYDFPTVVVESGFAEKMDDLTSDARLWLMHTGGQTSVVVVVAFVEVRDILVIEGEQNEQPHEEARSPGESGEQSDTVLISLESTERDTSDETTDLESGEPVGSTTPESSVLSSVPSLDELEDLEPTEESILLARINQHTNHRKLASDLLGLHLRSRLSNPLLGRIKATVHIFRRNAAQLDIEQTYNAVLLPAPQDSATQSFTLTMDDLLASAAVEEGIDPTELVTFPLSELRDVVAEQIPKMEKLRSMARARAEMKRVDVWEEKETFAQFKRGRKRKVRENEVAEGGI